MDFGRWEIYLAGYWCVGLGSVVLDLGSWVLGLGSMVTLRVALPHEA